jgi:hypothetical protein
MKCERCHELEERLAATERQRDEAIKRVEDEGYESAVIGLALVKDLKQQIAAEKQARETAEQENVKLLERVAELGALESVEELFVGQYWDGNEWISPCCQGGSVKEAEAACERFGASMNAHTRIVRHSQQVVVKHGPPAALNTANAGEAGE